MTRLVHSQTLSTGVSRHPGRTVDIGASLRMKSFPMTVVFVETSDGYWLFDTGVSHHLDLLKAGLWSRTYEWVVPFTASELGSAASQLDAMGIGRHNISAIVLSHFHADHIGGLRDFPNARIIGHSSGLAEIQQIGNIQAARRALFDVLLPDDIVHRFEPIESFPQIEPPWPSWAKTQAWRLSSDESMIAVSLPGHATGQIGLLLDGPNGAFHVADASWTSEAILKNRRPSHLTRIVHANWSDYLLTLERLHRLEGPTIIPCHCSAVAGGSATAR